MIQSCRTTVKHNLKLNSKNSLRWIYGWNSFTLINGDHHRIPHKGNVIVQLPFIDKR